MKWALVISLGIMPLMTLQAATFGEVVDQSYKLSPLLKPLSNKVEIFENVEKMINSYHLPQLELVHSGTRTNNPVAAFGFTMMEESFNPAAMSNASKMNNPDWKNHFETSATIALPVDIRGKLFVERKSILAKKHAAESETKWVQVQIQKNLYSLIAAYQSLGELEKFFQSELNYLDKIIAIYDGSSGSNRNRYLSYNQARIIREQIKENLRTFLLQKESFENSARYITGIVDLALKEISLPLLSTKESEAPHLRADLADLQFQSMAKAQELTSKKLEFLPELMLFTKKSYYDDKWGVADGTDTSIGFNLTWRFGLNKAYDVGVKKAEANTLNAVYLYKKADVENEMKNLKTSLTILEEQIKSSEVKHQLFRENKDIITRQYQQGSLDLYNMLDNFIHYLENFGHYQKQKMEYADKLALYHFSQS